MPNKAASDVQIPTHDVQVLLSDVKKQLDDISESQNKAKGTDYAMAAAAFLTAGITTAAVVTATMLTRQTRLQATSLQYQKDTLHFLERQTLAMEKPYLTPSASAQAAPTDSAAEARDGAGTVA
ncbi:hypothetical protein ES702_01088 [subsurface metagenome]